LGRSLIRLFALLVLLPIVAVLWLAGRIVFHSQSDDAEHLITKQAYLDRVADLAPAGGSRPNLVLILFDDLGYGDLGAYGSASLRTPSLDRLAAEGVRFRHGYAASPYCSASRAGLLTGRFAVRSGLDHVVQAPWSWRDLLLRAGGRNRRLPLEEITLAELLSAAGYATAIFGKWHLGDESPSLPHERGFDEFYGLLHSNDQGRPEVRRDGEIVEHHPIDQAGLTRRYTDEAVRFLEESAGEPFFLYLPQTFPHVPLHAPAERRGASEGGLYGDVVEELDASVGRVLETLERLGLAEDTLVVATSDNGPWFQGSGGGVRGRKMEVFEGGTRVPWIVRWPAQVSPGQVIDTPITGLDLFPTILAAAGLPAPEDRILDGASMLPLLTGETPADEREIWYLQIGALRAVRAGRFKYHDRHRLLYGNPMDWPAAPFVDKGPWLFDLELDPDESYDVGVRHPEVVRRLAARLAEKRREVARNPGGWRAAG
jgi:arylsulfatase A-like enzyme